MTIEQAAEIVRNVSKHGTLDVVKARMLLANEWLKDNPTVGFVAISCEDDNEPITFPWVAANFRSAGPQYRMRIHDDVTGFYYVNRSECFKHESDRLYRLKTRGDVRRFVASIGVPLALDKHPDEWNRNAEWLEI